MTLDDLQQLLDSGEFHHATYRDFGTVWEGLWIYRRDADFRGFWPAGMFNKNSPDLPQAENMVRHTGVSVGSFGNG